MIKARILTIEPTPWFRCQDARGVHISANGDFAGGLVRLESLMDGVVDSVRSPDLQVIFHSVAFNQFFEFRFGDVFRLNLTGTTGTPNINFQITGEVTQPNPLLL